MSGRSSAFPGGRLFGSLFLGGFECSTHLTPEGHRHDVIAATQHDRLAAEDYARCRAAGILSLRDAARWPVIDRKGRLDLSSVRALARLAREQDITIIWDLLHYGYPDDLDPRSDRFGDQLVDRFVTYAAACARAIRAENDAPGWYTPVNEISYTAWAAGDVGIMAPFWHGRGFEYKHVLVDASIRAFNAIRTIDPDARTLTAEPLVRLHVHRDVTDPEERERLQRDADDFNVRVVSEAYDMLGGRVAPHLGGTREHLGVVGVNYYEGNQWTIATPALPQHFLGREDPTWLPLSAILAELSERYGGPIVISETGSSGEKRVGWIRHLTDEAAAAIARGVDLQGICLYPIVTSPDWNDPTAFFEGGLWDIEPQPDGTLERVIVPEVAEALRESQLRLSPDAPVIDLAPAAPAVAPQPRLVFAKLAELARFSPDGFVCIPVLAGEALVADVYCFEPGKSVAAHRHADTEHVLTTVSGVCDVRVGDTWVILNEGESLLVPAGLYHGIHNASTERALVYQVSSPKPWDARFHGPRPSDIVVAPSS